MQEDIYDPLTEYVNVFKPRFKEVAKNTFAELAAEAHVDVTANRETCRKIYEAQNSLQSANESAKRWKILAIVLWVIAIVIGFLCFLYRNEWEAPQFLIAFTAIAITLALYFIKVNPEIKAQKQAGQRIAKYISQLESEAWKQMEPLNQLYDWDILTRMMSQTVPRLEFDPYFTTQRLADLKASYNWDDSFNEDRSVIYSHSGLINGNPFIICRTRKMEMGQKVYEGTKTIYWTTTERDANGQYRTVQHSETLHATVTAPYPYYFEKTRIIYGNTAAPDLTFYRKQSGLANKEGSLSYKLKRRSLRQKARNLTDSDFAMLTNEEFEVAFNTSNRNNNQQYALLFTPLAQESMLKLLKDNNEGYGDDFDFEKNKMINAIHANHMQKLDLDMNPRRYQRFDYDKAEKEFSTLNADYFRAIYFAFAPLLCVPMYQQIRPAHDIYKRDMERHSSFWEHEALANFWGQDHFKSHDCVTDCILKTESKSNGDEATITVHAYGYRAEDRVSYIGVWGGDGNRHSVPVYWKEYFDVEGTGEMKIREDNNFADTENVSQRDRLSHINTLLSNNGLNIYRRHIASRV